MDSINNKADILIQKYMRSILRTKSLCSSSLFKLSIKLNPQKGKDIPIININSYELGLVFDFNTSSDFVYILQTINLTSNKDLKERFINHILHLDTITNKLTLLSKNNYLKLFMTFNIKPKKESLLFEQIFKDYIFNVDYLISHNSFEQFLEYNDITRYFTPFILKYFPEAMHIDINKLSQCSKEFQQECLPYLI